ncbi:hypothetical protein K503DRAFT_672842, partial [Rhizopogon vinicolor AM-OR11-026]
EVMQRIADVIRTTDRPSSLRSVPYNFGEAKAGTLKADEWRTLTTVYLPIALRLIGQLQRLPTNHIFGQQESTLLRSYIKAAKLKHWLNRPSCPPVFRDVKCLFDRFVSPSTNVISEDHLT